MTNLQNPIKLIVLDGDGKGMSVERHESLGGAAESFHEQTTRNAKEDYTGIRPNFFRFL
jgi:hypothetical protein